MRTFGNVDERHDRRQADVRALDIGEVLLKVLQQRAHEQRQQDVVGEDEQRHVVGHSHAGRHVAHCGVEHLVPVLSRADLEDRDEGGDECVVVRTRDLPVVVEQLAAEQVHPQQRKDVEQEQQQHAEVHHGFQARDGRLDHLLQCRAVLDHLHAPQDPHQPQHTQRGHPAPRLEEHLSQARRHAYKVEPIHGITKIAEGPEPEDFDGPFHSEDRGEDVVADQQCLRPPRRLAVVVEREQHEVDGDARREERIDGVRGDEVLS